MANNAENERLKRAYFTYLREALGHSESSLDAVAKALNRFEVYTRFKDFRAFHIEQATAFKKHLSLQVSQRSGTALSKATLYSTLMALKKFFQWLAGRPGFRSRLGYSDAEYFNLSEKETRIAKAVRETQSPTLAQIHHVLKAMPAESDINRRDRALIAFAILTGARDSAIASMKMKHINLMEGSVFQDGREVKTKFSKTFTTYFFPVGPDILQIFSDWVAYLHETMLWGYDDPLFPATQVDVGQSGGFEVLGLKRAHWSNATAIRKVFREAFERAGLPYFNPHTFRKTLALLGEQSCGTPEEFKAWSQNLGHEKVLTTFLNYGTLTEHRQAAIMRDLCGAR